MIRLLQASTYLSLARTDMITHVYPRCYWYQSLRKNHLGIIIHLSTILPAAFLAVFQFVPVIRHRFRLYHRIAGYVIIILVQPSQAGVIMVANHAFTGDNATRSYVGALVLLTTIGLAIAYVNIKRLQIDQHRAWMLRTWFYFATIITLRIILIISAGVTSTWPAARVHIVMHCDELPSIFGGSAAAVYKFYPACKPENLNQLTSGGYVAVLANFGSSDSAEVAAALDAFFGMSGWMALLIHAILVEVYLRLTPRETDRLRQVSHERQMERGFKNPGSAGLVLERFGDADEWIPEAKPSKLDTESTEPKM